MILRVTLPDGPLKMTLQSVLVDLRCLVREFISQLIHQALHEVTLAHQKVLSDAGTVPSEFILLEKDLEQLLVRDLIGMINPLSQTLRCFT